MQNIVVQTRGGLNAQFYSDPKDVGKAAEKIVQAAGNIGLTPKVGENLKIILTEIFNNIVEHAYQGATTGLIEVSAIPHKGVIEFRISDFGRIMPNNMLPEGRTRNLNCPMSELPEGGFGWFLIHTLADQLHYHRKGDENRLTFRICCAGVGETL